MAINVKFLRQYDKYRKHSEHTLADKVAVYFIDNAIAEATGKPINKKPCEDCGGGCKDCKESKKKNTKKKQSKTLTKKKAPKK